MLADVPGTTGRGVVVIGSSSSCSTGVGITTTGSGVGSGSGWQVFTLYLLSHILVSALKYNPRGQSNSVVFPLPQTMNFVAHAGRRSA